MHMFGESSLYKHRARHCKLDAVVSFPSHLIHQCFCKTLHSVLRGTEIITVNIIRGTEMLILLEALK